MDSRTEMRRKERAASFRNAAALMEKVSAKEGVGCCDVLDSYKNCKDFERLFRPTEEEQEQYFGGLRCTYWMGDPFDARNKSVRATALCFMAAMVEAGDA